MTFYHRDAEQHLTVKSKGDDPEHLTIKLDGEDPDHGATFYHRDNEQQLTVMSDGDDSDHGVTLVTFYHRNRRDGGAAAGSGLGIQRKI